MHSRSGKWGVSEREINLNEINELDFQKKGSLVLRKGELDGTIWSDFESLESIFGASCSAGVRKLDKS